ncbi:MAG: DinB family protein [Dehalococcoidia bacterium]
MGAFTYPRSEPGSAGHMDLVERLQTNSVPVQREIESLSDEAAARRPSEGEWSAKETLGHLCDYASHLHDRLYRMIKLEDPLLAAWDQIEELNKRNPQAAQLTALLDEYMRQRAAIVEMLTDLVHWNWARCGRHETLGRISIRQLVDRAIAHDDTHVAQLRSLVAGR